MDRFKTLLQRYQRHTASAEEKAELFSLVRKGEYDDIFGNEIAESLREEMGFMDSPEETNLMERIYNEKIAGQIETDKAMIRAGKVIRLRTWLAAAAIITAAVFGVQWLWRSKTNMPHINAREEITAVSGTEIHLVKFSEKQLIRLPDGSKVLLNKGSELTYNQDNFGKNLREVTLSGEAFFDIEHDPSRPFQVHTGKIITTVLGTAFNILSSPGKQQVTITVTRGKVKVGDKSRTYDMITPDQEMVVNTSTSDFIKQHVDSKLSSGWKDQFLILDNVTMQQAVDLISERFNVKVQLANPKLSNCHISASFFNGENLEHVLDVIGVVNQITYAFNPDGSVALDGSALCK